jgi:D-tyrosyl-tRNA(Tyr) deacylase
MRVVLQRVSEAEVKIAGKIHARIGKGYLILLGIRQGDSPEDAHFLADKCAALRVFEDDHGKMNLSLMDVSGSVLAVSQFTLYADAQKGNRPSFALAARPDVAEPLYEGFVRRMRTLLGQERVLTGVFGAMMEVRLVNDGPVTVVIESPAQKGESAHS